ncbi:MAG: DUF805 domain-containing protein [Lactobacillus crispatus]|uniref:DUF805 domain-containing protein n=1 Tax=Lactobacillus crispatus TaxID=47770 RepID=UPI0001EC2A0F|nr:DUF805 domain-containing protein [Lactobacillus crispatus]EFQ45388.1 hypothetical protein LBKG_00348 [Lactobacillus crispatus CTV-05]MCT7794940.1 DUF805 domain-containing protein [Lactobacillus crispatus]MCT7887296.1 DUF805 domain-containing protein [Lactobacillus crispatus]
MRDRVYYFIKPYDESLPLPPAESFAQILNEAYLHPFNWKARTTRKSFWWSTLINLVIGILCIILGFYAFNQNINPGIRIVDGIVAAVVYLWLFLAALGQTIRRLHDVGYSGYWYWAAFTGYGAMFLFYLELQPSVQRQVKWGKYFFSNQDYPAGHKETVPVPTIGQILKEHFFDCFKWNARSTRTSFWVGTAINQVTLGIGTLFIYAFSAFFTIIPGWLQMPQAIGIFFLCFLILLLVILIWSFLAQLGHTVRRLHDAGFNGGWWWLGIVPYVGDLLLAFLLFHPTVDADNKWNKYLFDPEDRIR